MSTSNRNRVERLLQADVQTLSPDDFLIDFDFGLVVVLPLYRVEGEYMHLGPVTPGHGGSVVFSSGASLGKLHPQPSPPRLAPRRCYNVSRMSRGRNTSKPAWTFFDTFVSGDRAACFVWLATVLKRAA